MYFKLYLVNATFITICVTAFGQTTPENHTDLKEYGLFGKIKTMTIIKYYSDMVNDSTYKPLSDKFDSKKIFHFNISGNIDSIIWISTYYSGNEKPVFYNSRYISEFDKDGNRTGFKGYDFKGNLALETEIKWKDKTHYTQTDFTFDVNNNRQKSGEVSFTLNSKGRELTYINKVLKPWDGSIRSETTVANTLDLNGFLLSKRMEYKGSGGFDQKNYKYKKIDSHKNACEIIETEIYTERLSSVQKVSYTYY